MISYVPPKLGIVYSEHAKQMSVIHRDDGTVDSVLVSVYYLNNLSEIDIDKPGYLNRADGKDIFYGNLKDFAFLTGVEEAHHSAYQQSKKTVHENIDASNMPVAEYDAIEHEFRSLLFRRSVAKEYKLPQDTIDYLNERIENAKEFRKPPGDIES